ncbi:MAG TPA: TonB-dependent receptor [Terracidiphilus sp.]|nr:TonB-dependent receptor [Terracidiphilus sp.]
MEAPAKFRIRQFFTILGLLSLFFFPGQSTAQLDRGEITGTVEDPSGAMVQDASVTLINDGTSARISARTTVTGTYVFDDLFPGKYTIEAERTGFQKYVVHGLIVHVQQITTVDVHFTTGNVQQSVTVTAAAPLLEAENAALGQTITNQAVNDLPLATRDWGSLAQLSAGVSTSPSTSSGSGVTADAGSSDSAYFSVNGVNNWQNDFRLNGINDNIEVYGGNYTLSNAAIVPPPDAIEEFSLQSGDFQAEFGHSTGGVIDAAIKSGTNGLHGDAWEYLRNNDLNANYFFNRTCSSSGCVSKKIPEYHQNLFGFTAGGPIEIPHVIHGKDRLFWFADYQGGRYVLPEPAGGETVPTLNMVNSGFTNLQDNITGNIGSPGVEGTYSDAMGRKFANGTILDPATTRQLPASGVDPVTGLSGTPNAYVRDPFFNCTAGGGCSSFLGNTTTDFTQDASGVPLTSLNVIPTSRQDPNAVKLLGVYPAPETSTPLLVNNFASYVPLEYKNTDTWDIRVDANISPKDRLFGVYDRSLFNVTVPSNLPGEAVGETGGRNDSLPAYAWAAGYTRILTPTMTNDMHVGMVHSDKLQQSFFGNTFGIPASFGIQGVPQVANNGGLPPTTIAGLTHVGVGNYTPTLQYVWSIEGVDAVTKVVRNHTLKAGIQVDDLEGNISQPPQGRGDFSFNGMYTDVPNRIAVTGTGLNGIGDLLVAPTDYEYGVGNGVDNVGGMNSFSGSNISATDDHRWYIGAYFQDDWKVSPALTLNLGLRWDLFTPYTETRGYQANFIPVGGNGASGTYYMSSKGCAVARATIFNTVTSASNININCNASPALGNDQKDNFAPRMGFAYRIQPNLVVRGGFGTAYGALGNLGYGGTLGTNYPFVYTQTIPAPDSNHPLLLGSPGTPATMENTFTQFDFQNPTVLQSPTPYTNPNYLGLSLYGRQLNFQTPLVQTENLTVEDQFTKHDAIQVGFVGTQGRHLDILGYNNGNTQILPNGTNAQLSIPFPDFGRNSTYETTNANSSYNSLQVTYQHQMSFGLFLLGNYTWSKCMSDQHTQASEFNDSYRAEWLPGFGIQGDYGLCDSDAANLYHLSGSYNLPFGRGREIGASMNKAADLIVGGWQINFFYTYQSGQPFTVTCPNATSADFGCAADLTGQALYSGPHNFTQWLNPAAFVNPPPATTAGQTDYSPLGGQVQQARGPIFSNLDSSILKNFNFTESTRLQFRAEAFNTTNTPPFAQPGQLNFTSGGFSSITATKNSNENFGARTLQLALKLFY